MEAKLIKTFYGYELLTQGFVKGSTNHELIDSLNIEEGNIRYKLSLKNCQVIELDYDLDELALKFMIDESYGEQSTDLWKGYLFGFQKALSILGDKKFSEEDMIKMWEAGANRVFIDTHPIPDYKATIQSLQQNEWSVEIVEEDSKVVESHVWDGSNDGELTWKKQPKLDADGCIILKRK